MAVVTAAAGFEAHVTGDKRGELSRILHRFDSGKARHRGSQLGKLLTHEQLVLRVEECGRLGLDVVGGVDKRAHMFRRHVLVFEGHRVCAFCGLGQYLVVVVVTKDDIWNDLRGGLARLGR